MAASVKQISVGSPQELESTITGYIAQGFVVSSRTPESVTLFKKKEFNILWAVIGFFLCLLPLLVYCVVYATQSDEMVTVAIVKTVPAGAIEAGDDGVMWSEDRQWWWDGAQWRDALLTLPPAAVFSEDRSSWWDGVSWRPVPGGADSPGQGANPDGGRASDATVDASASGQGSEPTAPADAG
jgi:hypothetical protein